jgi:Methyltransferase domain
MNLSTALTIIAQRFGFNAQELIAYAAEDAIGGYNPNPALAKWPMGSLWEVEGKTLYALVRVLRPQRGNGAILAAEIGTHRGASATHIIAAMKQTFKETGLAGFLMGCDLGDYGGDLLPTQYQDWFELHHVNGIDYLAEIEDGTFSLIFEDASHDAETTAAVAALAQRKLAPGGVLVVHDAAHFLVGADIRAGLDAANLPGGYGVYLCEPSDCGLAVWRKALDAPSTQPETPAKEKTAAPKKTAAKPTAKKTATRKKAVH